MDAPMALGLLPSMKMRVGGLVPVGTVAITAGDVPDWLPCDGRQVVLSEWPDFAELVRSTGQPRERRPRRWRRRALKRWVDRHRWAFGGDDRTDREILDRVPARVANLPDLRAVVAP